MATRRPNHESNFLGTVFANVTSQYADGPREQSAYAFAYVAHGETKAPNPYIVFSIAPNNSMVEGVPLSLLMSTQNQEIFIGFWRRFGVAHEALLPPKEIQKVLMFWDQWKSKRD